MADEDTFKDIYEIILGIGQEWENLTDIEQASLGEAYTVNSEYLDKN